MKKGQAFGLYQSSDKSRQFVSGLSIPDYITTSKWLSDVQASCGLKAIGVFIIKSLK